MVLSKKIIALAIRLEILVKSSIWFQSKLVIFNAAKLSSDLCCRLVELKPQEDTWPCGIINKLYLCFTCHAQNHGHMT